MPTQSPDYAALAKQFGGVQASGGEPPKNASVDYAALAKRYGGQADPHVDSQQPQDIDHAALAAKHGGEPHLDNTVRVSANDPSLWQRAKTAWRTSETGRTVTNNLNDAGQMLHRLWQESKNPLGMSDAEHAEFKKSQDEFFDRHLQANLSQIRGTSLSDRAQRGVTKAAMGGAQGVAEFAEDMMSPQQIALLAGTFGESALTRAAKATGIESLVPAAKVVSKLAQAHFIAQMTEGAATGIENTVNAVRSGDWKAAGQSAVEGLVSGLMAKETMGHEAAVSRVQSDLNTTAREMYGQQASNSPSPVDNAFSSLDPHRQAQVIDETVKRHPAYQDVIKAVDAHNEQATAKFKAQRQERLNRYYETAVAQAWELNVTKRTIRKLQGGRQRRAEMDQQRSIDDALRAAREQQRQQRIQAQSARVQRREEQAASRSEVGRVAEGIATARDQVFAQRSQAGAQEPLADVPRREVETVADDAENVAYPAEYWGEQNTFGASGDVAGHSVYRQTPRGVEWLDANGNFTEEPESLYTSADPETADTLARLSSLSATADTVADDPNATAEQRREAEEIAGIRRDLVSGEIDAGEAQRRAGLGGEPSLPDEYTAAREGKLNGPYAESSYADYAEGLRREAKAVGMTDEEVGMIAEQAAMLARQQTEGILHHVYQPGDYIVSQNGVRWTLDSKGVLHPDSGGNPVPLMRRGLYSNDAFQLAQSGRVGYGSETREQRRVRMARERKAEEDIKAHQEEVSRELQLAAQREGLLSAAPDEPRVDVPYKQQRESRRMSRPPRAGDSPIGSIVRLAFQSRPDENSIINAIAQRAETTPEEVMRLALANEPGREETPEGKIARIQPGDSITDPFRPARPWMVEEGKDGKLYIRSGNASPLPLDRLNPSERVRRLVEAGRITQIRPEFTVEDAVRVAYEKPHYFEYQERIAEEVSNRKPDPEPRTEAQAEAQSEAAERRAEAAEAVATRAQAEIIDQPAPETAEAIEQQVQKIEEKIHVAEEAYAQSATAAAQTLPRDAFPPRAPASVGLKGASGTISQNSREIPFHYELLPIDGLVTSHVWQSGAMAVNEDYPAELQPRTVSEAESKQNAFRAERRAVSPEGRATGYDFRNYSDRTINGSNGPAIVEEGGRVVGGNTRIAIMRRHLENLEAISDPEEREAAVFGFRAAMRKLAQDSGITQYPDDDQTYVVVRMMDKPIADVREAAELGRLFNKSVGVQITKSAKGVSYSKSFDDEVLADIGRRVEVEDGINGAMQSDPEFFRELVINRFGVEPEEYADWFTESPGRGLMLNDQGKEQFEKALLGTVIKDSALLNRLEGKTPYRAASRALGYLVQMRALPGRDISGKVLEALQAASDTLTTDPGKSVSNDKWLATYHPDQVELLGMEADTPPEPDRVVEALWRALHASDAASPRVFNDRLKNFLQDDSSRGGQLFAGAGAATPAEAFNQAFSRELREVQHSRKDSRDGVTEAEFEAALQNRELSDAEREEVQPQAEAKPAVEEPPKPARKARLEPPPTAPTRESIAARDMAISKAENGYVTPDKLRDFLAAHPATKDSVPELMKTADVMAKYVFDVDPPVGIDRKDALDWVLRERLAGIESGELTSKRGQYSDPNIEKNLGDRIMKLHQAADATTFIHEFAHVVFPMLGDEDLRLLDTIRGKGGRIWDGTRKGLAGEAYADLSEKFAHGLEQFLRDENPTGFTSEVKMVLAKVKEIMRKVYLAFSGDPLAAFQNTEESREVFSKMFGITDFDAQDRWHKEVRQARAEEKRLRRPEEEKHPLVKDAAAVGATGLRNTLAGKVEDSVGARVDPRKPVAAYTFPDQAAAVAAWDRMVSKLDAGELIEGSDGTWGIRFNTKAKVPTDVLYQDVPPRHIALELERAKKELAETPESSPMIRKLRQLRVQNLENEIRSRFGAEETAAQPAAEAAKDALREVKNGRTNAVREGTHGDPRVSDARKPEGISRPPRPPVIGNAVAGQQRVGQLGRPVAGGSVPRSLAEVKPVGLEPLNVPRGTPVGTTKGEAFDQKAWTEGLRKAGLPESVPPPTWALDRKTADKLIFPGQKQVVQTALSALEQGDGMVVATATGSGKAYTSAAVIREYKNAHPDAKILFITKNASLLKTSVDVGANTFGFDITTKVSDGQIKSGVYGGTYNRIISNKAFANTKWDLVVSDESGEARNWYREDNKQGKALMDITANAKKAVWFSATPFHSPSEYGYLNKMGLWPKGGFDRWIENNFAHEKIDDRVVAKLDPAKQAKLRQQLIERGQLISQAISYEGFTAHFGVVPVTDSMKRGLDRIHEGFARAKKQFVDSGKKGLADKVAAFEATYTKAFLERERIPQAIELAKKARANGWQVAVFSETSSEDLFRRDEKEPGTYQQLDQAMGGQLSKIIPPFGDVFDKLREAFGDQVVDYSGRGNTGAERDRAKKDFLTGEAPMIFTTYAAGGVGVSLHDADFPELGVKGGERPRVAIYLGPPYSGVLLEQAMGRFWRFGVKSDTHAVFLATDSEPDVRLMQQKVGPRMRALRASVLGERDSLASVMSSYNEEEKVRARQEALAYAEGNEQALTAKDFAVRNSKRNVGLNNWSEISFPPASSAINKGMRYGDTVSGGDWSTLYQSKFNSPNLESPATAAGKAVVDAVGNGVASGTAVPTGVSVSVLEPADRDVVMGAASAAAAEVVERSVNRDTRAAARQTLQSHMNLPGDKNKWVLTFTNKGKKGVWRYTGDPEDLGGTAVEDRPQQPKDIHTWYMGNVMSQEIGIQSIARQAGALDAGENIVRMNRSYQADADVHFAEFAMHANDIMRQNDLDEQDAQTMSELWDVVEGKRVTESPAIERAAQQVANLHERVHAALAGAEVKLKTPGGEELSYKEISKDRNFMPHRIDWDAKLEDPATGETHTLKEVMGETFAEAGRRRILSAIAAQKGYTYEQVAEYLNAYKPNTPVLGHIHRARTIDFPFIKKDWQTLMGYYRQASDAISIEKNFGHDRKKLDAEIARIPSDNGRKTISAMFKGILEPQEWNDWTAKAYNAAISFEALTKMTISVTKVPFHLVHIPVGLKGRIRPFVQAAARLVLHPKAVMENAEYAGTVARQLNVADVIGYEQSGGLTHEIFGKTGFDAAYKLVRTIAGESSRVWMEQYAMRELQRGNAAEARRLLKDVMLIGDGAIDQAIANGRFSPEDLAKGQTAFANLTTWSNNPLQMPRWARLPLERSSDTSVMALNRAVRLTYALQSFSLKTTSFLREQLFDEVVKHGNLKPLAYAIVAYPVIGQLLAATSAGSKHVINRSLQGLTHQNHDDKDKDSWDKMIENWNDMREHPEAVKALKFYVDSLTLGTAWDRVRRYSDLWINQYEAKHGTRPQDRAKAKKDAVAQSKYLLPDEIESMIGASWDELVSLDDARKVYAQIDLGSGTGKSKQQKINNERRRYLNEVVPITKQIPSLSPPPKGK